MAPPTNILDHIVHLSHHGKLSETITHWEKLGFKVTPGGTHAGGLTSNALVALADGVYIELIAFEKPPTEPPASENRWAKKQPGWIDWACLGLDDHIGRIIAERDQGFHSGVEYHKGQDGGRKRASDGKELKWRLTVPRAKHGQDVAPFFCQDVTPRELRVPAADLDTHVNTAVGVAHIHLKVPHAQLDQARAQLSVVFDSQPNESDEWELVVPHGRYNPAPRLKLVGADDDTPIIVEVGFYVKKAREGDETDGFGKVVFKEL
ncbi:glyoxalase-like domain-containing protein [Rhizoctonia solani]|nr:glyoxalase-like domain-containing protein [Rhizoctonia solani]